VKKPAFFEIARFPEIQFDGFLNRFGRKTKPFLRGREIGPQRNRGRPGRNFAETLADDQFFFDKAKLRVVAETKDRPHRIEKLRQAGRRKAAHDGQTFRQPDGFDDARRRGVQTLLAKKMRDAGEPEGVDILGVFPEPLVKFGRSDARAVAGGKGQTIETVRDPRRFELRSRKIF
jgi:hypothetical protein